MSARSFSIESLVSLSPQRRAKILSQLSDDEALELLYDWRVWARPEQLAPDGDWQFWLVLAGRGWGKTKAGAGWIHEEVEKRGPCRVALIGPTAADVRDVMIGGASGLLASAHPRRRPVYEPSKRLVTWPNGAIGLAFSADEPERLRGPQFDLGWGDEIAAWRYPDETWSNFQFGLRLGDDPRAVITTTPKPTKHIKELRADPLTVVTGGSTYQNRANLAKTFISRILRKYEGTRLGRQELHAEVLDDNPGALWKRASMIEAHRVSRHPRLLRIVVAVDPAVSANAASAETGIIAAGLGEDGHGYVLGDYTLSDTPAKWGNAVVAAYNVHEADRVVGEVNNGGDLVEANVRTAARDAKPPCEISYKAVRASRGKQTRAEPIAALYEQGRIHHVGSFPQLEDQLCDWDPTTGAPSPDRLDADVWALTELMLGGAGDDDDEIFIGQPRR
jgi:phage terminase large subunit-like protein